MLRGAPPAHLIHGDAEAGGGLVGCERQEGEEAPSESVGHLNTLERVAVARGVGARDPVVEDARLHPRAYQLVPPPRVGLAGGARLLLPQLAHVAVRRQHEVRARRLALAPRAAVGGAVEHLVLPLPLGVGRLQQRGHQLLVRLLNLIEDEHRTTLVGV